MNAVARSTLAGLLLLAVVPSARAQEKRQPGEFFIDCPTCPEMVVVPAGSYRMGSFDAERGSDDERPAHRVTIRLPFAVGVHEVTFAEWDACVRAGGCAGYHPDDRGWGRDRHPVIHVSWDDAQRYVHWLSRHTGEQYRLLSEAEWEYVARAGSRRDQWYYGRKSSRPCQFAIDRIHAGCTERNEGTEPVGSVEPNPFGLYDVLGNVWEWTEDCWQDNYQGAPDDGSAWRLGHCSHRVVRGGSWYWDEPWSRSAVRAWNTRGSRAKNVGFRVARNIN